MAPILVTAFWLWTIGFLLLKFLEYVTDGFLSATLKRQNINLYFCFVSFYTTRFNDSIEAMARRHRRPLNYWFSVGVCVGLLGLLASVIVLSSNIFLTLPNSSQSRMPLLPNSPSLLPGGNRTHGRPRFPNHHPSRHIPPPARIPFLHGAPRPWWIPKSYWRLLVPRDHDAIHSAQHHYARSMHRGSRFPGGGGHGRQPRGNCYGRRKRMEEFAEWNADNNGIPAPALSKPTASLVLPGPAELTDEQIEADLNENGDKSEITISWRRKPQSLQHSNHEKEPSVGDQKSIKQTFRQLDPGPANKPYPVPGQSVNSTSFPPRTEANPIGTSPRTTAILTPLVPGVTIPAGDIWYMIAAVLIAVVLHELGHALAAGMQNAKVSGVGGFLAFAFPGAYVQLNGIEDLTPFAQLKVHCAGAWHNFVIGLMALFIVATMPIIMSIAYATEAGAMVVSLPDISPLEGHLEPGDIILGMGQYPIDNGGLSFRSSVRNLASSNESVGFCVSENMYWNYSRPKANCCDQASLYRVGYDEQSDYKCFRVQGIEKRKACMDPNEISAQQTCRTSIDCMGGEHPNGHVTFSHGANNIDGTERSENESGGEELVERRCFVPVLSRGQQLVDIKVRSAYTGDHMSLFYEGYPRVLGQSVTVSSYVPRFYSAMPFSMLQLLASLDLPNMLERLLQYLSSISFALALLNMAPVFYMDGDAASMLYVRLFAPKLSTYSIERARNCILIGGTGLLIVNLLLAFLDLGYA